MPQTTVLTEAKACLPPELCEDPPIWRVDEGADGLPNWETLLPQACQETGGALCLTSAASLSQSHANAIRVAHQLQEAQAGPISVLDAGTTGIGLGLIALEAARLAQREAPLEEIYSRCQALRQRVQTLGVLETLDPLVASGLVPAATGWRERLGEEFTGIFLLQQGVVELLSAVYSRRRGLERLAHQVTARCRLAPVHGGIMYSTSSEDVDLIGDMLAAQVNLVEFYAVPMHASLVHVAGPGALAVAFFTTES